MGVDGRGVAQAFVGEVGRIEAGFDEAVIDKFGTIDGEFEQGVGWPMERGEGVDIAVDLEVAVLVLLQFGDELRQNAPGRVGGYGGIDDEVDAV